ncbi:receptor-like protein 19 [Quercus robur]|uniref:receptor-like protein 19 n=1 Tax=Quercus robur TaxID=38942 RepID=UPI0021623824|nr:receptor-like protein 19 [Quercus robur]
MALFQSLSNLANLSYLDISSNDLTGIVDIDMFRKLEKLETLDLHANLLHGKVPVLPSFMHNFFTSNNRLRGEIPSMICNTTFLTILDISNNNLSGTIPSCLGNFSNSISVMNLRMNNFHGIIPENFAKALLKLQVLVLRSNKFHGPIENYETSGMFFSKLRILDLSHNKFIGPLPSHFFKDLKALTTNENEDDPKYIGENFYHGLPREYVMENYLFLQYQDSVIIAMKGNVLPLKKILTIFSVIDLSRNMFYGKIPKVLGTLKFLQVLNFSHNRLKGHIPSSLANLSMLESLDLSSNMLTGEIPMQLTSMKFLAALNLSQNLLTGPIPQGKQFNTFQNVSYDGNLELCGFPLSMKCSTDETQSPPPPPSIFEEDNDSMFASGFGWKSVLMGYGCGLVIEMTMGYIVFKIGKPHWLVRFLTSGIKYVNVKMGDYDLREILKELRQMMNEVSKKVKVFSKSHKAMKELSKLKENTKASTEKKKELSSLESMGTEVQTKPQEPVAIGMEQEHTVGIEVTVIEHKDFLGLEHVEECYELSNLRFS